MATTVWVKSPNGLANKYDPAGVKFDPNSGVAFLSEAYNVDLDIRGRVSRRLGFESTDITSSCHSLFFGGTECVGVIGSSLSAIGEDLTARALRTVSANNLMSYAQVGDSILYMNGAQKGVVKEGASWDYEMPDNIRYPDTDRVFIDPPIGHIVRVHSGRVYIAVGNALWYSEPFAPNLFRQGTNWVMFPGKITMIAPVIGGLFVSTANKIYFLLGNNPKEFTQQVVAHYPAIEGTDVEVDGIAVLAGELSHMPMQMFTTANGICVGLADGRLMNLTFETLDYPKAVRGSAVYTGSKYIVSLEA